MPTSTKLKGRYELKEVLAKGGMGVVYRAVDGVMRRQVAIKTLLDITDTMGWTLRTPWDCNSFKKSVKFWRR